MSPLERCELLTPIPEAEVRGRLADGQLVESQLAPDSPMGLRYYVVDTLVLPVTHRRQASAASLHLAVVRKPSR